MSLPPYNHTRNPALEKENEFGEYAGSAVPLITHNGVVEKRKTTDRKLIRSQPPHDGVEFEYFPILSSSGSTIMDTKSNASKSTPVKKKKDKNKNGPSICRNDEKKKIDKSIDKENEDAREKIVPSAKEIDANNPEVTKELSQSVRNDRQSCKRCKCTIKRNHRDEMSLKSNASDKSICSEKSRRSASTVASVTSTIRDAIDDKRKLISRRESSTPEFRFVANGLDEEDQFPRRRR